MSSKKKTNRETIPGANRSYEAREAERIEHDRKLLKAGGKVSTTAPATERAGEDAKSSSSVADTMHADAAGLNRLDRDPASSTEWSKILERLTAQHKIDKETSLSTDLDQIYRPFEFNFDLARTVTSGGYTFATEGDFNPLQVEALLDQAADLLDRAVRDRAEWQRLGAEAFKLVLEITEYAELDKIHRREADAGFYTLPSAQSTAALKSEERIATLYDQARNYFTVLRKTELAEEAVSEARVDARTVSSLAYMDSYEEDSLQPDGKKKTPLTYPRATGIGKTTRPSVVQEYVGRQFDRDARFQSAYVNQQEDVMYATAQAASAMVEGRRRQRDWDNADIEFRLSRTEISRQMSDLKAKAATARGGVLNYAEQMEPVRSRVERDFRDAHARLQAAKRGLTAVYGYDPPLPVMDTATYFPAAPTPDSGRFFDECLIWVRDAIAFLVGFSHHEQNYVLPVSTRDLVVPGLGQSKKEAWTEGLKVGRWQVRLDEALFRDSELDARHVRLRGISAFVVTAGDQTQGVWQVTVTPPKIGTCRHLGDRATGSAPREIDQRHLRSSRIGRVTSRDSARQPDVVGVGALHNASPFGVWTVSVKPAATLWLLDKIEDLQLDLHLAFRHA